MALAPTGTLGGYRAVLRTPQFRKVLVSDAFSGWGDVLYWVALVVLLLDRDPSGSLVAGAVVARLVPRVAFGVVGGVVADRFDRRRLLVALDASRAVLMFLLAAIAASGGPTLALLAVVFVTCTLSTPYRPALAAGYPLLVPEKDLATANAMIGTVAQVSALTGPLLGALLLTVGAPAWSFVVNGCSYLVSVLLISRVDVLGGPSRSAVAPTGTTSWTGQLATGIRSVRAQPAVLALTMAIATTMLLRGFELVLHVRIGDDVLGLGAAGYGLISAALGAGAVLSAPFAGRLAASRRPGRALVACVLVGSVPFVVLSGTGNVPVAMGVLAMQGASVVCFEIVALTMMQRACRRDVLGRVFGVQSTCNASAKLCGSLLAPLFVVGFGVRGALVVAALVPAALGLALAPRIFAADRASSALRERIEPFLARLTTLGIFDGVAWPAMERLAMNTSVETVPAGTVVVREGDVADDFFIIDAGDLVVRSAGVEINRMSAGDWFGEIGLVRRAPRTATVVTVSEATLWRIPGDVFVAAVTSSTSLPGSLTDEISTRLARSEAAVARAGGQAGAAEEPAADAARRPPP